ncbi:MAG: hypothetical protein HYS13_18360 [Planctomycetia bacterium]|nr:hypothetical protein [Planctomycetia bacterium]
MRLTKLKIATAVLFVASAIALTCGLLPGRPLAAYEGEKKKGPAWGEAVEGVGCRLRGAWPTFQVDIRNEGKRELTVCRDHGVCIVEIDGETYYWFGAFYRRSLSGFGPGAHYEDIVIDLDDKGWLSQGGKNIALDPGKHKIRVTFEAYPKKQGEQSVLAVSNAIEFETRSQKQTSS